MSTATFTLGFRRLVAHASGIAVSLGVLVRPALALAAPGPIEDIRDIRGPIPIAPWWQVPLWVALGATAALSVVFLVRWIRARRTRPLTPLERARRAIDEAEAHARAGRMHAFADAITTTLRGALSSRLGLEVLPQTTSELEAKLATPIEALQDVDATRVISLLEACDLARFAKAKLDLDALLASTQTARELIERLLAPVKPNKRRGPSKLSPPAPSLRFSRTVSP